MAQAATILVGNRTVQDEQAIMTTMSGNAAVLAKGSRPQPFI
jgi:hypothetical protein